MNYYKGVILVLLSALGFGLMTIFAKLAYGWGMNVSTLLVIRFALASVFFFIYAVLKHGKPAVPVKTLFSLFVLGGVFYTMQSTFYFSSVKYIPPSLAALLLYVYPIFVAVLSFFIDREKLSVRILLAMGLSFAGLALVLGTSAIRVDVRGAALALGAAFVYSCYIILGNRVTRNMPSLVISAYVTLFAATCLFLLGISTKSLNFQFDPRALLPLLGIILFSTILAIFTFFRGLELVGSNRASVLSMVEPVFTALVSMLVLQDMLTPLQMVGGLVVIVGAVFVVSSGKKKGKGDC